MAGTAFLLKQTFAVDPITKKMEIVVEDVKETYYITWKIKHRGREECLWFDLDCCPKYCSDKMWNIDADCESKMMKNSGEHCISKHKFQKSVYSYKDSNGTIVVDTDEKNCIISMNWSQVNEFVINNKLTIECHVTITKTDAVSLILRSFDESMKQFSDVVLIVKDQQFYVSKLFLASHSKHFESLFSKQHDDHVVLEDVKDPEKFQTFLEVLYGEPAIKDCNVHYILKCAKKYNTPTVFRQCEMFLMKISNQELNDKFRIALEYDLQNLKSKCFSDMKTEDDIRSVLQHKNIKGTDHMLLGTLMEKLLSFQKKPSKGNYFL